jgi:hypothetical protein
MEERAVMCAVEYSWMNTESRHSVKTVHEQLQGCKGAELVRVSFSRRHF